MRNLFLFMILFLFASTVALAQSTETNQQKSVTVGDAALQKGNWMVGGSLGSAGYYVEGKSFNFNLNPKAGYFLSDDIVIGASTNVALYAAKNEDNIWSYGIGPFARYYIPGGENATGRFFGEGRFGVSGNSVNKEAFLVFGVGAGYSHFVTKSVALEVLTEYNYSRVNVAGIPGNSRFGLSLGFQIYLPGKR